MTPATQERLQTQPLSEQEEIWEISSATAVPPSSYPRGNEAAPEIGEKQVSSPPNQRSFHDAEGGLVLFLASFFGEPEALSSYFPQKRAVRG